MVSKLDCSVLLQDAGRQAHEDCLDAIFQEVKQDAGACDSARRTALVADGVVPALVVATKRKYNQCVNFYHRTFGIFAYLPGNPSYDGDADVAAAVITQGGIACMIEFLKSEHGDGGAYTTITCFIAFIRLMLVLERDKKYNELLKKLAKTVLLPTLLQILRLGCNDYESRATQLYSAGCNVLGNCSRHMETNMTNNLYVYMVDVVMHGILFHHGDSEAQAEGRKLLSFLVGLEKAISMIDHFEMRQCKDAECSCAA